MQPCLLLLLLDGPAHGYELIRRLAPYDVTHDDPGHVYRGLRSLESAGLTSSSWAPSETGPSRRVYDITRDGRTALERWAPDLQRLRGLIDQYLVDYAQRSTSSPTANHASVVRIPSRRKLTAS